MSLLLFLINQYFLGNNVWDLISNRVKYQQVYNNPHTKKLFEVLNEF